MTFENTYRKFISSKLSAYATLTVHLAVHYWGHFGAGVWANPFSLFGKGVSKLMGGRTLEEGALEEGWFT